jgi:hypothetical protein
LETGGGGGLARFEAALMIVTELAPEGFPSHSLLWKIQQRIHFPQIAKLVTDDTYGNALYYTNRISRLTDASLRGFHPRMEACISSVPHA